MTPYTCKDCGEEFDDFPALGRHCKAEHQSGHKYKKKKKDPIEQELEDAATIAKSAAAERTIVMADEREQQLRQAEEAAKQLAAEKEAEEKRKQEEQHKKELDEQSKKKEDEKKKAVTEVAGALQVLEKHGVPLEKIRVADTKEAPAGSQPQVVITPPSREKSPIEKKMEEASGRLVETAVDETVKRMTGGVDKDRDKLVETFKAELEKTSKTLTDKVTEVAKKVDDSKPKTPPDTPEERLKKKLAELQEKAVDDAITGKGKMQFDAPTITALGNVVQDVAAPITEFIERRGRVADRKGLVEAMVNFNMRFFQDYLHFANEYKRLHGRPPPQDLLDKMLGIFHTAGAGVIEEQTETIASQRRKSKKTEDILDKSMEELEKEE